MTIKDFDEYSYTAKYLSSRLKDGYTFECHKYYMNSETLLIICNDKVVLEIMILLYDTVNIIVVLNTTSSQCKTYYDTVQLVHDYSVFY